MPDEVTSPPAQLLTRFPVNIAVRMLAGRDLEPTPAQYLRFREFAQHGDPPADALVAALAELPREARHAMLDRALRHGVDAVEDAPEALVAFCRRLESTPYWVDPDLLRAGARAIGRIGALAQFPLADVSLMGGYLARRAVKPLVATGELSAQAPRRLAETTAWFDAVTTPGALAVGADGYRAAAHVRIVHAYVRAAMHRRADWDYEQWDAPVNQTQTVGTLLLFSVVFTTGARVLGVRYSAAERRAIHHLWRYVGWLLGIDDELLPADEADAWRLLHLQAAEEFDADDDSRTLGQALADAYPGGAPVPVNWPGASLAARAWAQTHLGLARLVLGRDNCRELGLPPARLGQAAVLTFGATNFAAETLRRRLPGATALQTRVGLATRHRYTRLLTGRMQADTSYRRIAAQRG